MNDEFDRSSAVTAPGEVDVSDTTPAQNKNDSRTKRSGPTKLKDVSDKKLIERLGGLLGSEHRVLARLIEHLIEVEERRLDRRRAYTSMFDFCVRRLGLSEGEAYRRITAARLVRRYPHILEKIERRQIHLSALVLLREHLTDDNHEELVALACGRRTRELQELLACRFPRPAVPERIRKLPSTGPAAPSWGIPQAGESSLQPRADMRDVAADAGSAATADAGSAAAADAGSAAAADAGSAATADAGSAATAVAPADVGGYEPARGATVPPRSLLEPLSETRYKLQLTIDAVVREKLERASRLMSHSNPTGDLSAVISRALDLLVADLERTKLAKTTRPREQPAATKTKPGYVTRHVRREVFARDGEQCTFVDEEQQRCPARSFLELDHIQPRALGGTDDVANLRVRCRLHNHLHAEQVFGRDHVAMKIHLSQRKSLERTLARTSATREPRVADETSLSGESTQSCDGETAAGEHLPPRK